METAAAANSTLNSTRTNSTEHPNGDNTLTFIIGFGILILFVLLGILASAFLCFTLKKDPYLWEAERERQMQQVQQEQQKVDHQCSDHTIIVATTTEEVMLNQHGQDDNNSTTQI